MQLVKLSILFISFLFSYNVFCQSNPDTTNLPVLEFVNNSYHFGDIQQGEKVSHEFIFKNTGKSPLVVSNVLSTCGCAVPVWPKEPILPGKSGLVKVFYNSAGKIGPQNKIITLLTNTRKVQEPIMLIVNVLPPRVK